MSKKRIEQKFSKDILHCMNGISSIEERNEVASEEYKHLLELGEALRGTKECDEGCSQRLRGKFMMGLEKENGEMKKVKSLKKIAVAAVSVATIGIVMAQTTFGQNLVSSIIGSFTTGKSTVLQLDREIEEAKKQARIEQSKNEPMPEEYKGKIFDENGNEFTYFPAYLRGAYNAKGEELVCATDGEVYTQEEWTKYCEEEDEPYTEIKDSSKLNEYTSFSVGMPNYLPKGVKFECGGVYSTEDVKDNMWIEIIFTNEAGEGVIHLCERLNREETKGETYTYDEVKEVDINGVKGLMYDNVIKWETDETRYEIYSMDESISMDEIVKVAQSIR